MRRARCYDRDLRLGRLLTRLDRHGVSERRKRLVSEYRRYAHSIKLAAVAVWPQETDVVVRKVNQELDLVSTQTLTSILSLLLFDIRLVGTQILL